MVYKIVIDTNIYISAIFWGGKPRDIIDLGRDKKVRIFTSTAIEEEIIEKLKFKVKLSEADLNQILFDLSTFTIPVSIEKKHRVVINDPDDDKFIDCAAQCSADFIISGDRHLLEMQEFIGIKIVKASEFLSNHYAQQIEFPNKKSVI